MQPSNSFIIDVSDSWTELKNEKGHNLLELFYKDKRRWAYTFQTYATLTRFEMIQQAVAEHPEKQIFLTERCLETDYEVFTKMLVADGSMDQLEFAAYGRLFKQLRGDTLPLSAIVHISTPPELCLERINRRGRGGEERIPLEYLKQLSKFQDRWLRSTSVPVFHTDGNSITEVSSFLEDTLYWNL